MRQEMQRRAHTISSAEEIAEPKLEQKRGYKIAASAIGKVIQKKNRAITRTIKQTKIDRLLSEFKGLKVTAGLCNDHKAHVIGEMRDIAGTLHSDPQGIANALAGFYKGLYASKPPDSDNQEIHIGHINRITPSRSAPIRKHEVKIQLKSRKTKQASDDNNITA